MAVFVNYAALLTAAQKQQTQLQPHCANFRAAKVLFSTNFYLNSWNHSGKETKTID